MAYQAEISKRGFSGAPVSVTNYAVEWMHTGSQFVGPGHGTGWVGKVDKRCGNITVAEVSPNGDHMVQIEEARLFFSCVRCDWRIPMPFVHHPVQLVPAITPDAVCRSRRGQGFAGIRLEELLGW